MSVKENRRSRKDLETELLVLKEKIRLFYEHIPEACHSLDSEGVILQVNDRWLKLLGYTEAEVIGRRLADFVASTERGSWIRDFGQLLEHDCADRYESKLLKNDGREVSVAISGRIERDQKGAFVQTHCVVYDISKSKQAFQVLEEDVEELGFFFSTSLDLLCIASMDGQYRKLSLEWEKALGYRLDEIQNHNFSEFVHPDDMIATQQAVEKLAQNELIIDFTNRHRHKNGTYRYITWRSSAANGLIYSAARDITEKVAAELLLQEQHKLSSELNEMQSLHEILSHSLKTTMRITGMASGGIYLVDKINKRLDLIVHEGLPDNFIRLVEQLPLTHPLSKTIEAKQPVFSSFGALPPIDESMNGIFKGIAALPITYKGELVGCLNLASKTSDLIPVPIQKALISISNQIGGSIARAQAEEAKIKNEKIYRTLIETANEAIVVIQDGVIKFVNENGAEGAEFEKSEILSRDFLDFVHPDDKRKVAVFYRSAMLSDESSESIKFRVFKKSGQILWLELHTVLAEWEGRPAVLALMNDLTKIKMAEAESEKNAARWKELIDTSPFGAHLYELGAGNILRFAGANQAADRILRKSHAGLVGTPVDIPFPGNPNRTLLDLYISIAKDGFSFQDQIAYTDSDGIEGVFKTYAFQNGRHKMAVFFWDITEEKRVRDALYESESKFKAIADQLRDVIYLTDLDGVLTFVSPSSVEMFGFEYEEMLGQPFELFLDEIEVKRVQELFHEFVSRPSRGAFYDLKMKRKDGHTFDTELSASPLMKDGAIVGTLGSIRDITFRKQIEESLQDREAFLRESQRVANIGSYKLSFVSGLWQNSETLDEILGIDEHYDRSIEGWQKLMHPDYAEEMLEYFLHEVVTARNKFDRIYMIRRKSDGVDRWVHGMGNLRTDDSDNLVEMYGTIQDITEKKLAEFERDRLAAQLQQAQKMESVGRLAGGVAHDFNNMLMAIMGNAEMALEDTSPDNPTYWSLQEIVKAAQRSADLTKQLLTFARKQTINPVVLDLNDKVEGMLKMLRRLIGEQISLIWLPGADLWKIKIDPVQIDQILANLCVNAKDAIEAHGNITLSTSNVNLLTPLQTGGDLIQAGEYVVLEISDTGSGIPPEIITKIFEPFFTTKESGKGTGLGLATVYGIVQQNNGRITVRSEPGNGAVFNIYFPKDSEFQPKHHELIITEDYPRGTETILFVEDEPAVLYMGKSLLAKLGYKVLPVQSPEAAIELFVDHHRSIDLLITDVVMPGMNGAALVQRLLQIRPGLKCIFISGYTSDVPDLERLVAEGSAFIQKPFSLKTFAEKVRERIDSD